VADGSVSVGGAVKLHQIRCVVAAARRGSFRGAAAALNLQQSSVSRCVRELEDHLGALLFARSAAGVELTPVGVRFVEDAEHALDHLGRAAEIAGAVGREAQQLLRIGAVSIPGSGFLPEALQAIASARPRCRIRVHEASSADNLIGLRAGALDVGVVLGAPQAVAGTEVLPLWREALLWAIPAGDRRAGRTPAAWRDIGPDGLVLPSGEMGELVAGRLAEIFGRAFLGAACRAGPETAMRLVAMGQGTAVVSAGASSLAPPAVSLRPIADDGFLVSAVRLNRNDKPALRRLMGLFREMAAIPDGGGGSEPATVATTSAVCARQIQVSQDLGARSSGLPLFERRRVHGTSVGDASLAAGE
jgi:DNA-binding transcriptional LysR family regulator